jgi:putative salt-induced outer membrane protein
VHRSVVVTAASSLLFVVVTAAAQDDDEEQTQALSGKAAFGYLATSGNTESTNTNAALSLVHQLSVWRQGVDLAAVSASNAGTTTAEAYRAAYEARRALGQHAYVFTAIDWKADRFSGYAEQVSETVGYGRRLIDGERHVLDGGIGGGIRQAELRDGVEEDDRIVRGSLSYLWTVSPTTEFEQRVVVESGSTNTSLDAVSSLRARLLGEISLVLSYRVRRNTDVPVGAVETDRFSSVSLEYAF